MLPNGLRLIVQPQEHVSHTVSVFGRVRLMPAMQEPPGKEGIASLMRGLFEYGTEKLMTASLFERQLMASPPK